MAKTFSLKLGTDAEYAKSVRKAWSFRPTTRIVESKKAYKRASAKREWKRDMD